MKKNQNKRGHELKEILLKMGVLRGMDEKNENFRTCITHYYITTEIK